MGLTMIHWRLREVMDREGIQAKVLAEELGVTQNSISNMRRSTMPRMNGDTFNSLLIAINKLRREQSALILPNDVLQFSLTPDEMKELNVTSQPLSEGG